uniref:RNA-binding protein KhpA n=1 Tax=Mesoaciditoga lauensis TaxID=1495039 RepID=A0A7V3RE73_9BACT
MDLKEPLEFFIKSVSKEPQLVKISEKFEGKKVIYEIFVSEEDIGQIIGKDGRTIKSIDLILRSLKKGEGEFELKVIR